MATQVAICCQRISSTPLGAVGGVVGANMCDDVDVGAQIDSHGGSLWIFWCVGGEMEAKDAPPWLYAMFFWKIIRASRINTVVTKEIISTKHPFA